MKCTVCGGTALVEGSIVDYNTAGIKFRPGERSLVQRIFGGGTRNVHAYGCTQCGHLQLAVEFTENDLERYQQFEGRQPSVLERLNTDESEP